MRGGGFLDALDPLLLNVAQLAIGVLACLLLGRAAVHAVQRGTPARRARLAREADERAEALLRELLSPAEYQQLLLRGYLDVASPRWPDRVYRIPRRQGQVQVYEGGQPTMALCVQSLEPIPEGDTVLMHKLMIEGNEEVYLRTANRFRPRPRSFTARFW